MRRAVLPLLAAAAFCGSAAAATIRGTARADLLRGTPAPDRIVARGGNDRIDVAFGGTDSVDCGAGTDLIVADGADRVSRDCETVVRRISVDPFTDPASQHETAVEPDSFAWGSTVVAAFQLGRFRDGGASGIGVAVSRDAGRTWRHGVLPDLTRATTPPGSHNRASDPAVAYDAAHGTWLVATLGITAQTDVSVSRSSDALHWSAPVELASGPLLDKEWIACDNGAASPFRGRCYVVYTDDALHRMVVQESDDGGATWAPPVQITDDLLGAQPEIRPDGSLVVVAVDLPQGTRGALLAFRSTDGGATFSAGTTIVNFTWHPPQRMRAVPLPSAAVDPDGTVSVALQACPPQEEQCSASQIAFTSSPDGITWQPLHAITSGASDRFVVGLDADPAHAGRLALVYALFQRGSCGTAGGCRLGIAFQRSSDGGATWQSPQRLDALPFAQSWVADAGGAMIGDYFSVSYATGRVVPVFTLAEPPLAGRLREAIFAASLPG